MFLNTLSTLRRLKRTGAGLCCIAPMVVACDRNVPGPELGNYRQVSHSLDSVPLRAIRIEADHVYEADMAFARIRGTYRVARDSVFFDEVENGLIRVGFAGRFSGDSLVVRMPGLEHVIDSEYAVRPMHLVRAR